MTRVNTTLAAILATVALGAVAAPQIASAASCTVTKAHIVKKVVHKRAIRRPVAVAAYRESAPAPVTRTIVETRYIHEPARVIVAEPSYGYGYGYPVYYHHYGYYGRPYERGYYGHPGFYHHRHW
jgi:hypothetical protein